MRRILSGQRYGRLIAICKHTANGKTRWECKCDCGNLHFVLSGSLGVTVKSCGCLARDVTDAKRHGEGNTPTWNTWHSMLQRCRDQNCKGWKYYGGRGITVCERWQEYKNFRADMGLRPHGKSLGRIDNDGNYEPANCRWESPREQQRNTSYCRHETFDGRTMLVTEWAEHYGVDRKRLFNAMRHRSFSEALALVCKGDT